MSEKAGVRRESCISFIASRAGSVAPTMVSVTRPDEKRASGSVVRETAGRQVSRSGQDWLGVSGQVPGYCAREKLAMAVEGNFGRLPRATGVSEGPLARFTANSIEHSLVWLFDKNPPSCLHIG
jgi:hypothetical protein